MTARAKLKPSQLKTALGLLLVLCLAAPASASADGVWVTVHVQNEAGRDQVDTGVGLPARHFGDYTDEYGNLDVPVTPGEEIRVVRGRSVLTSCQAPPEGWNGASYTVPSDVSEGQTLEITLPDIVGSKWFDLPSAAEREFLGRLNNQRERKGLDRIRFSERLNAAADLRATGLDQNRSAYSCEISPHDHLLAADLGFYPFLAADGFWVKGGTYGPAAALQYLGELSDNKKLMMNPRVNAIGVANVGASWEMVLDVVDDPCDRPACQLTDDTGDLSPGGGGDGHQGGGGTAKVKLRRAVLKGKRLKLSFGVKYARGKVKAVATHATKSKHLRVKGAGRKRTATARLARGRWNLSATATGTNGEQVERCYKLRVGKHRVRFFERTCPPAA